MSIDRSPHSHDANNVKTRENLGFVYIHHWLVYTYPSEKYESQLGMIIPNIWKNKNVPNHQPDKHVRRQFLYSFC